MAALLASAREQRNAELPLEEWTKRVLALLPSPTGPPHVVGTPEDEALPDNIGMATRMLWRGLASEWSDFGEDDWAQSRAKLPRSGLSDEDAHDARAKLAAELFWGRREELLLTDDELHIELWNALRAHVSPPWPEPEELRELLENRARETTKSEMC